MASKRHVSFLSRKSIVSLIGIDLDVLEETANNNFKKFTLTGLLVIAIFVISFASVFYAFELMFKMWYAEVLLSIFFGLMFFNIYIFLIQTFSKEVLPASLKFKFFNLSNIFRIGFVLFLGYLIAQPIKIFFLRKPLDNQISGYKELLFKQSNKNNEAIYSEDLIRLKNAKTQYVSFSKNDEINKYLLEIDESINEMEQNINQSNIDISKKLEGSNFITKRIEYANNYKVSKLIDLIILIIFSLPLLLIYSISGESKYYALKKEMDREHVLSHYNLFKKQYQKTLMKKYALKVVDYYEPFEDPPFNTKKKVEPDFSTQNDFFNKYFNG